MPPSYGGAKTIAIEQPFVSKVIAAVRLSARRACLADHGRGAVAASGAFRHRALRVRRLALRDRGEIVSDPALRSRREANVGYAPVARV